MRGRGEGSGTPPYYKAATLGGLFRMKAYPNGRKELHSNMKWDVGGALFFRNERILY